MKKIIVLSIAVLSTACNPFSEFKPDSGEIVTSGWAKNNQTAPKPGLYCYRTLGEQSCHTKPLKGAESRLISDYDNLESIPRKESLWEETKNAILSKDNA